jgi:Raf kinase inhibitor-like YbhB/YbcL family protein
VVPGDAAQSCRSFAALAAPALAAAAALAALAAGCGTTSTTPPKSSPTVTTTRDVAPVALSSPAFVAGAAIPREYTCDGADAPPPLRWSTAPRGTAELVLVMRDADAPGGNFLHWAVAGLDPHLTLLGGTAALPQGAVAGRNDFGGIGYKGPCPPRGDKPHRYTLTLYALPRRSRADAGFTLVADTVASALGAGNLSGTYGR